MDLLTFLIDFVLHVDRHLQDFVGLHGAWVYVLLFTIVFVETGVVVMPFLPGDSLLFISGALAGVGVMDYATTTAVLSVAAVAGNQTNYAIGRRVGPRVFDWEHSRWFNRQAFDRAHGFYERWGGVTLVAGRFAPFLRTFAPFVAGVAQMTHRRFTFYDVTGGLLWVGGLVTLGWAFGNVPVVKANLSLIVWTLIGIPGVLIVLGAWRARRRAALEAASGA